MARTNTTEKTSFFLSRSFGDVTFTLSSTSNGPTTLITMPKGSRFTPDPHWHERYIEYFRVIKGRARLIVNGRAEIVTGQDGEKVIQPFAVHEFTRADIDASEDQKDEGDVVIEERVDPADGLKEVFFRNLFSAIQDREAFGRFLDLQLIATQNAFDNYPVLVGGPFSWVVTRSAFALASGLAWILNLKPWYEQYTPERIQGIARQGGVQVKPKAS